MGLIRIKSGAGNFVLSRAELSAPAVTPSGLCRVDKSPGVTGWQAPVSKWVLLCAQEGVVAKQDIEEVSDSLNPLLEFLRNVENQRWARALEHPSPMDTGWALSRGDESLSVCARVELN